ncbi:MAG: PEP-CTERM sorting domain-containing protein [Planctomycetota bacterium]
MLSRFAVCSATAVTSLALVAGAQAQVELTTNGGFEAGDTSSWDDFTAGNQSFGVINNVAEGAFAGEIVNPDEGTGAVVKQANIGIGQVNPGDMLTVSFFAAGDFGPGGVAFAEFFSELDGGGTSSAEILGGTPLPLTSDYQFFTFDVVAGSDVSGGVTVQFNAATGAVAGSTANLRIDGLSVVVPEPASLGLLGLTGVALLRRRTA